LKIRRFYPRQVLHRLRGRQVDTLSVAELHALTFLMMCSGSYGYDLTVLEDGIIRLLGGRGLTIISEPMPTDRHAPEPGNAAPTNSKQVALMPSLVRQAL